MPRRRRAALRGDLVDPRATALFGHGVPLPVQTMTRTMPGWNRRNATHMITIFAADLSHGDPALDTVTCMETPSTVAGYAGPPSLTISVAALWLAMRQFITDAPADPVNLISWTDQGVAARSATASRTVRRWYGCWSSR